MGPEFPGFHAIQLVFEALFLSLAPCSEVNQIVHFRLLLSAQPQLGAGTRQWGLFSNCARDPAAQLPAIGENNARIRFPRQVVEMYQGTP
jgi:hypothetical protein